MPHATPRPDVATLVAHLETTYLAVRDAMLALRTCRPVASGDGRLADAQHQTRHAHLQAVLDSLRAEATQMQEERP